MDSVVMVRTSWPSSVCRVSTHGEHAWKPGTYGLICEPCFDFLPWAQCREYQAWCLYLFAKFAETVARLN